MRYMLDKLGDYSRALAILMICTGSLHAQIIDAGSDQSKSKQRLAHVYRQAHILCNRDTHTVVPLRSIIYQPAKNESKVTEAPSGKFRFWPDFLPKNRDWLMTFEVTLEQAKGSNQFRIKSSKSLRKSTALSSPLIAVTLSRSPL